MNFVELRLMLYNLFIANTVLAGENSSGVVQVNGLSPSNIASEPILRFSFAFKTGCSF